MKPFLLILLLSACCLAQDKSNHAYILPGKVGIEWYFSDTTGTWDKDVKPESRVWLSVQNANHKDFPQEGWNPSYTVVFVNDCVPVVRKLRDNRYEIAFRSEAAKDLP